MEGIYTRGPCWVLGLRFILDIRFVKLGIYRPSIKVGVWLYKILF